MIPLIKKHATLRGYDSLGRKISMQLFGDLRWPPYQVMLLRSVFSKAMTSNERVGDLPTRVLTRIDSRDDIVSKEIPKKQLFYTSTCLFVCGWSQGTAIVSSCQDSSTLVPPTHLSPEISIINYQLPIIDHQSPIISYHLSTLVPPTHLLPELSSEIHICLCFLFHFTHKVKVIQTAYN